MKKIVLLMASAGLAGVLTACTSQGLNSSDNFIQKPAQIKNVIVMIGDGMGPQQIGLLDSYIRYANNPAISTSAFEVLSSQGEVGIARTEAHGTLVVDSAASATQFSSGKLAGAEMIGADYEGNATQSALEIAQQHGKAVGLVTDTRATHATPAAFAAHQKHRSYENAIALDILERNVDVVLGGGLRHWIPKSANDKDSQMHKDLKQLTNNKIRIKSKRKDDKNLLNMARLQGYDLSFDKTSLDQSTSSKILGLYSYSGMNNGIKNTQLKNNPDRYQPTLTEMTSKALSVLEKDDDGFFLMVEGGRIDWAAHANDAGTMLHEMIKFSNAIDHVLSWMKDRDDTLLIVTADHETGGFGFAYSRNNLPQGTALFGNVFSGDNFQPQWNFGNRSTLDKLYNQKMSYLDILSKFDSLDKASQTPEKLMEIVNQLTEFPITLSQAKRVLATEKNNYQVDGHSYLSSKTFPLINDREEFFVYGWEIRAGLLAMVTAKDSNIVWATDNHTSTPVYLFAYGPKNVTKNFKGIQHTTEWAKKVIQHIQ